MVGEYFGRCSPASLSLGLPQTKGPALSAATEQAMESSLSERHKEKKKHGRQALLGFLLLMPNFYDRW